MIEAGALACCTAAVGALSAGELSLVESKPTDEDVLASLRYFQSAEQFVTSYVYPSVWLLQPLFYDNDSSTDWAFSDNWPSFLRIVQMLDIFTCQVNCTASYKSDVFL